MRRKVASIEACVEVIRFYTHEGRESIRCKTKRENKVKRSGRRSRWRRSLFILALSISFCAHDSSNLMRFAKGNAYNVPKGLFKNSERFNARQTMRNRNVLSSVFKMQNSRLGLLTLARKIERGREEVWI